MAQSPSQALDEEIAQIERASMRAIRARWRMVYALRIAVLVVTL
jgi:hypothetical protein